MESYVETIFITAFLLMMNSCMIGMYVSAKPIKLRKIIVYCIVNSTIVSFLYFDGVMYLYILVNFFCMLCIFKNNIKTYIVSISTYILINISMYVLLGNSMHLFTYVSPINDYFIIIYWIIMLIIVGLLHFAYGEYLVIKSYVYNVNLCSINLNIKGYLDTGNLALYNDIPLVFLDIKLSKLYQNFKTELLCIETINMSQNISVIKTSIQIEGYNKETVYIHFVPQNKLALDCSCLLNIHMIRG